MAGPIATLASGKSRFQVLDAEASPAIVLARVHNHLALAHARQKLAEAHAMLAIKNKELEGLATHDSLTGLNNRFALDKAMNFELKKFG